MILSTLYAQINTAYRGSDDDAPASGTDDYTLWLNTVNRKIAEWANDGKHTWPSLFSLTPPNEPGTVATAATTTLTGTDTYFTDYQVGDTILVDGETVRTIATITSDTVLTVTLAFSNTASLKTFTRTTIIKTGVQAYNLHRNFLVPSDQTTVTVSADDHLYDFGKPQERDRSGVGVYISGLNPKQITFYEDIDTAIVGGTLQVPGYFVPNNLTSDSDVIPVDDPYWLVYAVASELAFNDLTYADKADSLNTKANNLYIQMASNNRRGVSGGPRVARTSIVRITGPERF